MIRVGKFEVLLNRPRHRGGKRDATQDNEQPPEGPIADTPRGFKFLRKIEFLIKIVLARL
jgi:hypothetical protein